MKHYYNSILLGTAAVLLNGCATFDHPPRLGNAIAADAVSLNESYGAATNAVLLANILRARDRWPTTYTTLSAVTSNPVFNRESGLSLDRIGLGNPSGPFQGSGATFASKAKEGGTYKVSPFSSADNKNPTVLSPVDVELFKEYFHRWPADVSTLLFVNGLEKWDIGDGRNYWVKPKGRKDAIKRIVSNDGENIEEFIEMLAISLGVITRMPNQTPTRDLLNFSINDHVDLIKLPQTTTSSCQEVKRPDSKSRKEFIEFSKLLKETSDVSVKVEPILNDVVLNVCKSSEDAYAFTLKKSAKHELASGDVTAITKFELRSLDSMVYFIGESLRKEQDVVRAHCKTTVRDGYGKTQLKSDLGPLFVVHPAPIISDVNYAVKTIHAGKKYQALPNQQDLDERGYCLNERSSTVMSILNQLLLLSQSPEALKTPENFFSR